ncbi:winged helix-turn-helix domain-containing protein [Zavarzinella formosa]|uniref:winged helix-turn-helix domain-containing protein n=1 Tax=Zavarzinella formosa TaxID=360055 RepID=UPI0009FF0061
MRSKGSASALEALRRRAVARVLKGQTQAAVADTLGVHPVTVAKWMAHHRASGDAGLAAKPMPGRPRFLAPGQERQVKIWLSQKPSEHGFRTDLWSSRRIVDLIRRKFGITFHPASMRRWLTERGYSPQRPARKARQRNDDAIFDWVANEWPRIQKKQSKQTPTLS